MGAPLHQLADVDWMKPVHVLVGIDRVEHALRRAAAHASGSGDCTRMPSWRSLRVQELHQREQLVEEAGRRQPLEIDPQAGVGPV